MKKQLLYYYAWIAGSVIFSLSAQIVLPFPFGFMVALGVLIVLPLLMRFVIGKKLMNMIL